LPRQEGSPYVLPAERGDGHFVGIQKPWQRVRAVAGLDDVRIHDLRHSFASIARSGGDSLYLVGKVLGHRQSRTTERYAHLKDDPLRAVADRTSAKIAAIMRGNKATGPVPAVLKIRRVSYLKRSRGGRVREIHWPNPGSAGLWLAHNEGREPRLFPLPTGSKEA
jgi:Phage integrase family